MTNCDTIFIVGTYEELVLGYKLTATNGEYQFSTIFTDHSHTASVRSVAVSSKGIAATGSADETIKLFDTNKRVEIGSLVHHDGAVTCLKFFGQSHMFSCSEDGTIAIWQAGSWDCLRTLKGHRGAVYSFSVHPSGKLALSCGKDKTLRTWNLITGRCAFVTNLKQLADIVLWSPTGKRYAVVASNVVDVYSAENASIVCSLNVANKISCGVYLKDNLIALGCEKGLVYIYDISSGQNVCSISSETNRVKSMAVFDEGDGSIVNLALATSDGFVKVYQIDTKDGACATLKAELNTGFRLLCIAVNDQLNGEAGSRLGYVEICEETTASNGLSSVEKKPRKKVKKPIRDSKEEKKSPNGKLLKQTKRPLSKKSDVAEQSLKRTRGNKRRRTE